LQQRPLFGNPGTQAEHSLGRLGAPPDEVYLCLTESSA
jgi:hypothetical protein